MAEVKIDRTAALAKAIDVLMQADGVRLPAVLQAHAQTALAWVGVAQTLAEGQEATWSSEGSNGG